MTKIELSIFKTLAFFAVFGRPLTLEEIWQYLYKLKASQLQVLIGLENLQKNSKINRKNQYYFLNRQPLIIAEFENRKLVCQRNWQKVKWVIRLLRNIPFVKNISIINSLAFGTSNEKSDIDILLIAKKNRLWTTRALLVLLLEIIGQNKNKWYQAGKFCLGFAFDENRLNLSQIKKDYPAHFVYWLASLAPVYDRGIYRKLIQANSLVEILPNWQVKNPKITSPTFTLLEKWFSGKLGDRLEAFLARIQINKVWRDPQNKKAEGNKVIADKSMLKMHPMDRRGEYQKKWLEILRGVLT
ncbi:MAG: hypothetical protein AAB785_01345 [Patescibacteria group bacterium]